MRNLIFASLVTILVTTYDALCFREISVGRGLAFQSVIPSHCHGRFIGGTRVTLGKIRSQEQDPLSDEVSTQDQKQHFMKLALRHAQHAFRENEVPVGAVIVDEDGVVIASARNRIESYQDPTAHAEICAIRKACEVKGNWRLIGCTLYTSLEPCPMCMVSFHSFISTLNHPKDLDKAWFSLYTSIYLSVCMYVCMSICLSMCLSIYLSVCLSNPSAIFFTT